MKDIKGKWVVKDHWFRKMQQEISKKPNMSKEKVKALVFSEKASKHKTKKITVHPRKPKGK